MTTAVSAKLLSTNGGNDKYKLFSLYTLYNTQFQIKLNRHYPKKKTFWSKTFFNDSWLHLCNFLDNPPVMDFTDQPKDAKICCNLFSPSMVSDIAQMAACFIMNVVEQAPCSVKRAQASRNHSTARFTLLQLRTDERERGVRATVKGVAVIMQKHYLLLNRIAHINSLYWLDTFQRTHKGFDRDVKRISSCSFYSPLSRLRYEMSHPQLLANFVLLSPEKALSLQFMPLISVRRDSEQVLLRFLWTPAPHHKPLAWMMRGAAALPSTPRAGWLPRLHSKVMQLSFVPASIRIWLTDCAPPFEQMWFLASSKWETLPSVHVHDHVFKEISPR